MAKKNKNVEKQMDAVDYMDKIGDWVEKNSKVFIAAFAALVLGVGAFWSYSLYEGMQIKSAAKMSGLVTRKIELLELAIQKAKDPGSNEFKDNLSKEIQDIQDKVLELTSKYPSKSLTDLALIKMSGFLESQGKNEDSLKTLERAKISSHRKLSGVLLLLKAKILHKINNENNALSIYDEVLSQENWKPFHAEALIQKALLNKRAGNFEAAERDLQKAKALNNSGAFFEDAEKYLRLIQYKKNQRTSQVQKNG